MYIYSEKYVMDWGRHVFPTNKTELLYQRIIKEGYSVIEPVSATEDELLLVHTRRYLQKLNELAENNEVYAEIPLTKDIINGLYLVTGGSILTIKEALKNGSAVNLLGGFHHAFSDYGEGFCLINDMAVAIRVAKKESLITKAVVIDCDLHQGNGTARIFQRDPNVFTFSIHQENNYPDIKMKSDIDIGLDDFTGDNEYLEKLEAVVPKILD